MENKDKGMKYNPEEKCKELARLLLEARDALPAITDVAARLHRVDLTLADRIEDALEPWLIKDEHQTGANQHD